NCRQWKKLFGTRWEIRRAAVTLRWHRHPHPASLNNLISISMRLSCSEQGKAMQKNRIELAGYTGAKATVRYLPSGTPVANLRMAEGYRYTDRNNQTQEHTNWHSLVFYGDLAEIAALYEKGDNIFVEGTLQLRQFTPKDGSQRTVYEIIVRSVHQ